MQTHHDATQERVTRPFARGAAPNRQSAPTVDAQPSALGDATQKAADEIAQRLWKSLPVAQLVEETGPRSMEQVIRAASASHRRLLAYREELEQLPETFAKVAVRVQGELVQERILHKPTRELCREMKAMLDSAPPWPPLVDAEFADLLPEIAIEHAQTELKRHCLDIVNRLFAWLERMQQKNLVGDQQHYDSSCRYGYMTRDLLVSKGRVKESKRERVNQKRSGADRLVITTEYLQNQDVTVRVRHSIHTHELYQPEQKSPQEALRPIPQQHQEFLQSLPDWLLPSLQLLEGDLIRQRCVAKDLRTEKHQFSEVVKATERTEWLFDPALVLGKYVLTGWGEREIALEEARDESRRREQDRQSAAPRAKTGFLMAWAVAAVSLILVVMFPIAFAVSAGGVATYLAFVSVKAKRLAEPDPLMVLLETLYFAALVFAAQAALYFLVSWAGAALVLAIVLGLVAYFLSPIRTMATSEAE